jgi:hypothetical protein
MKKFKLKIFRSILILQQEAPGTQRFRVADPHTLPTNLLGHVKQALSKLASTFSKLISIRGVLSVLAGVSVGQCTRFQGQAFVSISAIYFSLNLAVKY